MKVKHIGIIIHHNVTEVFAFEATPIIFEASDIILDSNHQEIRTNAVILLVN